MYLEEGDPVELGRYYSGSCGRSSTSTKARGFVKLDKTAIDRVGGERHCERIAKKT